MIIPAIFVFLYSKLVIVLNYIVYILYIYIKLFNYIVLLLEKSKNKTGSLFKNGQK